MKKKHSYTNQRKTYTSVTHLQKNLIKYKYKSKNVLLISCFTSNDNEYDRRMIIILNHSANRKNDNMYIIHSLCQSIVTLNTKK